MQKENPKSKAAEGLKRRGHGMAAATRGRARRFRDRRKEAARRACRGEVLR